MDFIFEGRDVVFAVVGAILVCEGRGVFIGIAAGVSHDDFLFFAYLFGLGDELFASVGIECWDVDADLFVFNHRVDAEVGFFNGVADRADRGGVEGFDEELVCFGYRDDGEGFEVGRGAVVLDLNELDHRGRCSARADAFEFGGEVFGGLGHVLFGFEEDGVWVGAHGGFSVRNSVLDGIVCWIMGCLFVGQEGADGLAFDNLSDVAGDFEVEDKEGDVAFLAHGQCGHVHDAEAFVECFLEGQRFVAGRGGVLVGVGGVDAVYLRCFEQDFAVQLGGSE